SLRLREFSPESFANRANGGGTRIAPSRRREPSGEKDSKTPRKPAEKAKRREDDLAAFTVNPCGSGVRCRSKGFPIETLFEQLSPDRSGRNMSKAGRHGSIARSPRPRRRGSQASPAMCFAAGPALHTPVHLQAT